MGKFSEVAAGDRRRLAELRVPGSGSSEGGDPELRVPTELNGPSVLDLDEADPRERSVNRASAVIGPRGTLVQHSEGRPDDPSVTGARPIVGAVLTRARVGYSDSERLAAMDPMLDRALEAVEGLDGRLDSVEAARAADRVASDREFFVLKVLGGLWLLGVVGSMLMCLCTASLVGSWVGALHVRFNDLERRVEARGVAGEAAGRPEAADGGDGGGLEAPEGGP